MIEDQNKFNTNYNTDGKRLTSTFQPPPRPGQAQPPPAQPTIPSGKGGQTPWNSTRSARDWLKPNDAADTAETPNAPEKKQTPGAKKESENAGQRRANRPRLKAPNIAMPNLHFKLPKLHFKLPKLAKPAGRQRKPDQRRPASAPQPQRTPSQSSARQPRKSKQPKVISATISGLIAAAIVLLAEVGLWGSYCYSHTLPGDTNVNASTFMYCFALFAGNFWAGAVVRRRSLKPSLIICGVFLLLSLLISLHLFSWREIKIKLLLLKIVLTAAAAAAGFILSLVPYLINKAIKKEKQAQEQRRQRQLERRQLQQQQQELERELARRTRGRF